MATEKLPPPLITKEHGSWAVLFVPMLVSVGVAGKLTFDLVLLALSALAVFLSYVPAQILLRYHTGTAQNEQKLTQARFWGPAYFLIAILFITPLLINGYLLLLGFGALGAISFLGNFYLVRTIAKTVASDLVAVAGLTLSAPSAYYVLTGTIERTAFVLYALNLLFFGCSVFYVHMKIRATSTKSPAMSWSDKLSLGKLNLFYHIAVVSLVALLAALHFTRIVALIAFVPMLIHGVYGTVNLTGRVRFKNLGLLLLGQSLLFGILLWYFTWV